MKLKIHLLLAYLLFFCTVATSQEDLLNQLDSVKTNQKEVVSAAFKGLQICNIQSTKLPSKGEWYVLISHRFGDLTEGINNFFGLDNAYTKIGAIYGAADWLSVGFSRHTYQKNYEFALKYRIAQQETNGFPMTIAFYHTAEINTALEKDLYPSLRFENRLSYSNQLLISRKFSDEFSLQLTPMYIHKNLFDLYPNTENKNQFVIASGGRYKLSKRLSFNLEYAARINEKDNDFYHNALTAGFDLETGGHVFQLVFSNAQQMNDIAVFTNATGNWDGGSVYFGFNMYRVF